MTTYTTQDLDEVRRKLPRQGDLYAGSDSEEFEVKALFSQNEEPDTWISYASRRTHVEYSCRLEAFLARFTQIQSDR